MNVQFPVITVTATQHAATQTDLSTVNVTIIIQAAARNVLSVIRHRAADLTVQLVQ